MTARAERRICPFCGARTVPVHVHGHAQCGVCGTNIEPCCDGASATDEVTGAHDSELVADPELFRRLFLERLGGVGATVTGEALLFALVERLDTDLDGAKVMLEAGEHTGRIESAGPDCWRLPR